MDLLMNPFNTLRTAVKMASTIHAGSNKYYPKKKISKTKVHTMPAPTTRSSAHKKKGTQTGGTRRKNAGRPKGSRNTKTNHASGSASGRASGSASGHVSGGYENQAVRFTHGHRNKIPESLVLKVREAISSLNVYSGKVVEKTTITSSICKYFGSPTLYHYIDMNQLSYNIEAATIPTQKLVIHSAKISCQIQNGSDAQVHVDVYECQARHDIPILTNVQTPILVLTNGFTDNALSADISNIAVTPFQSSAFCEWYKILSVKKLKFNPGEEKVITLTDKSPFLLNRSRYSVNGQNLIETVAKRGKFLLFKAWGQVAVENLTTANIGTTNAVINAVYSTRYEYKWNKDYANTNFNTTVTQTASGATTAMSVLTTPAFVESTGVQVISVVT